MGRPRFSCVFVNYFLGGAVEPGNCRVQDTEHIAKHRGGIDAVLPGHIHFPFRAHDYPGARASKYNRRFISLGCGPMTSHVCIFLGRNPTSSGSVSNHRPRPAVYIHNPSSYIPSFGYTV